MRGFDSHPRLQHILLQAHHLIFPISAMYLARTSSFSRCQCVALPNSLQILFELFLS